MIEAIKNFFRKDQQIVEQGLVWRCTRCNMIFLTKSAGDEHKCQDPRVN